MKGFLRATALLGSVTVLTLLVQIVRTKIVAVQVGREGMAIVAQLSDLHALLSALLLLGTEQGIVAIATDAYARGDEDGLQRLRDLVRRRVGVIGGVAVLLAAMASPWLVEATIGRPAYGLAMGVSMLALVAQFYVRPRLSILNGAKAFRLMAQNRVANAVLGLVMVIPLVLLLQIEGAVWSLATGQLAAGLACWWVWRRRPSAAPLQGEKLDDAAMLAQLKAFGIGTLISMLVGQGLAVAMRREIIALHGLEEAGLYQVAYSLTQRYLTIVLGAMAAYSFPAYRQAARDPEALAKEIAQTLRGSLLIITPIIIGLLGARELLIRLLFSADYLGADPLLRIQLVGDLMKVVAWAIGLPILAAGLVRLHVIIDIALSSALLIGVWAWSTLFGRLGPPLAFSVNFTLAAIVYVVALRRSLGYRIGRAELDVVARCGGIVLAVAWFADGSMLLDAAVAAAGLLAFAGLVVRRDEWKTGRRMVLRRLGRGPRGGG